MSQSSSQSASLLLLAVAWLLVAGCCPPKLQSYASPEDVLRSWQSQLCHDDVKGEYRCLSATLQDEMQGYGTYVMARRALLEEQPFVAAALKYFDLPDRAVERELGPDGRTARFDFEHDGQTFSIHFVQETWAVVDLADGPPLAAPIAQPLAALMGVAGRRQWIELPKPPMDDAQRQAVQAVRLDERWKIRSISGLPSPATGTGP